MRLAAGLPTHRPAGVLAAAASIAVLGWLAPTARAAQPVCGGEPATIVGTSHADLLRGTPGDDVIVAGGGNDRVLGLGGDDVVCGGSGDDTVTGGGGDDDVLGGGGDDNLGGGPGSDDLNGGPGSDDLNGGAGDDDLRGGAGDDDLDGGVGTDSVDGGAGSDRERNGETGDEPGSSGSGEGGSGGDATGGGNAGGATGGGGTTEPPAVVELVGTVVSNEVAARTVTVQADGSEPITCHVSLSFPADDLNGVTHGVRVSIRCVRDGDAWWLTDIRLQDGGSTPPPPPPVIELTGTVVSLDLDTRVLTVRPEGRDAAACRLTGDFPEGSLVGVVPGATVSIRCVRNGDGYVLTNVHVEGGDPTPPPPPAVIETLGTVVTLNLEERILVVQRWHADGTVTCRITQDFPSASFEGISVGALVSIRCVRDGDSYWLTNISLTA